MTDQPTECESVDHEARASALERELIEARSVADTRLIRAELKTEAVRAGIVDLDGLKLLDTSSLKLAADGTLPNASGIMSQLKRDKPWLFSKPNSSNPTVPPSPEPLKARTAKEMSYNEWQAARERLIRGR